MRKIVFAHKRAPGDVLMMTCGIRDFHWLFPDVSINVDTQFMELWNNNPNIDRSVNRSDPEVEYYRVGYPSIQGCSHGIVTFSMAFLLDMIAHADAVKPLGVSIGQFCSSFAGGRVFGSDVDEKAPEGVNVDSWRKLFQNGTSNGYRQYGDIYLTEEEQTNNTILNLYGVERYWIVAPGGKRDCTCKIWDWRQFQKVVDHYDGLIKFVVIGRSDHLIDPLRNVISFVDKTPTNLRPLVGLTYHAEGVVSGISFPMHLAAAVPSNPRLGLRKSRKPCVAIFGGREPWTFAGYSTHQILHNSGTMDCSDAGGCWQSRVSPILKDAEKNNRLCHHPVDVEGRHIPLCMSTITYKDVIRAIDRYYEGGLYHLSSPSPTIPEIRTHDVKVVEKKHMAIIASLQSRGGGEQSALSIAAIMRSAGWIVDFYPWGKVHDNYEGQDLKKPFTEENCPEPGIPVLFYANDQITDFCNPEFTQRLFEGCPSMVVGVNFMNGPLPKSEWIAKTHRIKSVVFQNMEKKDEWDKDQIGFESVKTYSLYGAIDIDKFYQAKPALRRGNEPLVVLKHCTPDYRKYVTQESKGHGTKVHVWQRKFDKARDVELYGKLLNETGFPIRFEFMEAHPELSTAFSNEPRMVFRKWDSMPVVDFLQQGHVYLYRTSNLWRDQYPRCVAEALATGMPVISEPRDGTKDRIQHGDTGFYACDYDQTLLFLKTLYRKEDLRVEMGQTAKEWAKKNLNPIRWVDILDSSFTS